MTLSILMSHNKSEWQNLHHWGEREYSQDKNKTCFFLHRTVHATRPYKKISGELDAGVNVLSVKLKVYFGKCLKKTLVVPQSRAFSPNPATVLSSEVFSFI